MATATIPHEMRRVRLLDVGTSGALVLSRDGAALFDELGDVPTAIVTFIGKARTGKSFSVDYLFPGAGMVVGHDNEPATTGADAVAIIFHRSGDELHGMSSSSSSSNGHSELQTSDYDTRAKRDGSDGCAAAGAIELCIIVVDTEGLATRAQLHDRQLLTFAVAASTAVVYHLSEYVYADDVMRLTSVAEIVRHLERLGVPLQMLRGGRGFPPVAWVVQRYELRRSNGRTSCGDMAAPDVQRPSLADTFLGIGQNLADKGTDVRQYEDTSAAVISAFPHSELFLIESAAPPGVKQWDIAPDSSSSSSSSSSASGNRLTREYVCGMEMLSRFIDAAVRAASSHGKSHAPARELALLVRDVLAASVDGPNVIGDLFAENILADATANCSAEASAMLTTIALPCDGGLIDSACKSASVGAIACIRSATPAGAWIGSRERREAELAATVAAAGIATHARNARVSEDVCVGCATAAKKLFDSAAADNIALAKPAALKSFDACARGPARTLQRRVVVDHITAAERLANAQSAPAIRATQTLRLAAAALTAYTLSIICRLLVDCGGSIARRARIMNVILSFTCAYLVMCTAVACASLANLTPQSIDAAIDVVSGMLPTTVFGSSIGIFAIPVTIYAAISCIT